MSGLRPQLLAPWAFALVVPVATAGAEAGAEEGETRRNIEVWYSYTADTREEAVFVEAVQSFRDAHPHLVIDAERIPYSENVAQFITASQGGEAPDLVRISHDDVGRIGFVRIEGLPLLEDLRHHLMPAERLAYDPRGLTAMRYENALYGIPSTQSCLALIYNRKLFDAADEPYPRDDWTTDDLLATARRLTDGDVHGMAVPVKTSYWWFGFQTGFGGALFDADHNPTLDSPGSSAALAFFQGLEKEHGVTARGITPESMKTRFSQDRVAMILDGPWNWGDYLDAGVDIGIALLPVVAETGLRMAPQLSYHGWAVSKQSDVKVEAVDLALWLTSAEVQRRFTEATYSPPTHLALASDPSTFDDVAARGFLRQAGECVPAPTIRGVALIFEPLDTALQLVYEGEMEPADALAAANIELAAKMRQ